VPLILIALCHFPSTAAFPLLEAERDIHFHLLLSFSPVSARPSLPSRPAIDIDAFMPDDSFYFPRRCALNRPVMMVRRPRHQRCPIIPSSSCAHVFFVHFLPHARFFLHILAPVLPHLLLRHNPSILPAFRARSLRLISFFFHPIADRHIDTAIFDIPLIR